MSATDADQGMNAKITFSLEGKLGSMISLLFRLLKPRSKGHQSLHV